MFTNLTHADKQAFFSLLDEYFESRPHLLGGGGGGETTSPVAQLTSLGRFISPPPSTTNAAGEPKSAEELEADAKRREKEAQRMDQLGRLAQKGMKTGASGASRGIGMISRNEKAMGALDKYGAGGLVRSADAYTNKRGQEVEGEGASPTSPGKKGASGLVSGKSFGHVDTSSKMSAFTSMWKDPQKAAPSSANTHFQPALASAKATQPPPRRGAPAAPVVPEPVEPESIGQAEASYDFTGADSGDLSVQKRQVVNIIEKTSSDWWTCEDGNGNRGLVPANYLREI